MEPTLVRHRPRRHLVYDQDFCVVCGNLGHYFFINNDDPDDIITVDCKSLGCSQPARDGVPLPAHAADTDKIEFFYEEEEEDRPRGTCFGRGGIVTEADAISGDIITSSRRKTE